MQKPAITGPVVYERTELGRTFQVERLAEPVVKGAGARLFRLWEDGSPSLGGQWQYSVDDAMERIDYVLRSYYADRLRFLEERVRKLEKMLYERDRPMLNRIHSEFLAARKARDTVRSNLLGTVYAEVSRIAKDRPEQPPTDEDAVRVLRKFVVAAEEVQKAVKGDQNHASYQTAAKEIAILNEFLPQMYTDEQLTAAIQQVIAGGAKNIGAIMQGLKAGHAGKFDGRRASELAKAQLS